jgi:hypothetical protein
MYAHCKFKNYYCNILYNEHRVVTLSEYLYLLYISHRISSSVFSQYFRFLSLLESSLVTVRSHSPFWLSQPFSFFLFLSLSLSFFMS